MTRRVELISQAKADLERLAEDSRPIARLALDTIRSLRSGSIEGKPLDDMAHTGDLSDCYKLYFG